MIRIGSRGSKLALWQANWVKSELEKAFPEIEIVIEIIKTTGDRYQEVTPPENMPKGLFTKEIQDALLRNEVDVAVHSLKDLATDTNPELVLAAISERANPYDALISRESKFLQDLPKGSHIGTTSTRRKSQLLNLRPDLKISDLRGNVDTRLRKLDEGQYDAIILAVAGLTRLGLKSRISQELRSDIIIPAVGQGALGIEIRANDRETLKYIEIFNHKETEIACKAERLFLAALGGGCQVPIACFAQVEGAKIKIQGCVASVDGKEIIKKENSGSISEYKELAQSLAQEILAAGASKLL
ncbi:MAG: hydroxymethylbilane synthase [Acidobacteria bacterium]|nr:hydroxymethylbilane synthase [Acidobacteriota bacterium]